MKALKVPWEMKVMFIFSVVGGVFGVYLGDDWLMGISAIVLAVLSCSISIMDLINDRFNDLDNKGG